MLKLFILSDRPAAVATTLACVIITPLGAPVVPLVYMMIAMSAGVGGRGASGAAWPFFIRSASVITSTLHELISAIASRVWSATILSGVSGSSGMYTTFFRLLSFGSLDLKTLPSTLSSFASATTSLALVWAAPCVKPSSPSVA